MLCACPVKTKALSLHLLSQIFKLVELCKKYMFFKALSAKNFVILFSLVSISTFQPVAHAESSKSQFFSAGETIEIVVQGENDLSGSYYIDKKGNIDLPLIGSVHVAGKTGNEIKNAITKNLKDGYIKNPIVTVKTTKTDDATAKKGIYVVGEIKSPGYYALPENASHLLNIVALAGGYTKQANKEEFEIVRNINGTHYRKKAKSGALEFLDGDIIIIKERL